MFLEYHAATQKNVPCFGSSSLHRSAVTLELLNYCPTCLVCCFFFKM